MTVSARLSHALHQSLGDEAAEDFTNLVQHMEASRAELRELNDLNFARIESRFERMSARFDSKFESMNTRFDSKFETMSARFDGKLEAMSAGFDGKLETMGARLECRIESRFADLLKWSFVFWVGAVAAIAALAGVLRR